MRELARATGQHCVAVGGSRVLDARFLGSLLTGAAQSGSWACLDGLGALSLGVLSVLAQQLSVLQHALRVRTCELTSEPGWLVLACSPVLGLHDGLGALGLGVLSVLAQQLSTLQHALRVRMSRCLMLIAYAQRCRRRAGQQPSNLLTSYALSLIMLSKLA